MLFRSAPRAASGGPRGAAAAALRGGVQFRGPPPRGRVRLRRRQLCARPPPAPLLARAPPPPPCSRSPLMRSFVALRTPSRVAGAVADVPPAPSPSCLLPPPPAVPASPTRDVSWDVSQATVMQLGKDGEVETLHTYKDGNPEENLYCCCWMVDTVQPGNAPLLLVAGDQIGRASCRERVSTSV